MNGVCRLYAEATGLGTKKVWREIKKYRKSDKALDNEVTEFLEHSKKSKNAPPGRSRKDGGDDKWKAIFCDKLYEYDGNYYKASHHTPYSFKHLIDMLNPSREAYDADFADMVAATRARISAEIEEKMLGLRHETEDLTSFDAAKIVQTKAWYYDKVLEKMDRLRWGKHSSLNIQAKVEHKHKVELEPSERLAMLFEDQRRYFEARKSGGALPESTEEITDAELVDEDEEEELEDDE